MLLRRITKHVKEQNWFAVALDFVIVVVGVFIGLQVSNWSASRTDRADEANFLERLHDDLVRVEDSSARVRTRRISMIDDLNGAAAVIFAGDPDQMLTEAQCFAIGSSHYYNINVLGLPSLTELANAGRVEIIQNREIRTALVEYQQRVEALKDYSQTQPLTISNLITFRPELVTAKPYFDAALGEMQAAILCDLAGMREDQAFLNALAENIDSYDAYLRDGLLPWSDQLDKVHHMVDDALRLAH